MKKITLIACAALVAGLLVSCNNGAKDYNDVTSTSTKNSYLVKGTITTVTETASSKYDDKDKQFDGESYKMTKIETIVSAPAYVTFGENEQFDSNYDNYAIRFDDTVGYNEVVVNAGTYWDDTTEKEKEYTSAQLDSQKVEKAATPDHDIDSEWISVNDIDGKLYYQYGDKLFEVTTDLDKITAGEDFTYSLTVVTNDSSSENTYFDKDGKKTRSEKSSEKITKTYDLTFTAQ